MQSIKRSILKHFRLQARSYSQNENVLRNYGRRFCTNSSDQLMDRVIGLVKKFDKADAAKVTETANFQKDLCLDSLDRTELVMAFEEEFSIEIPDEEADKLTSCADVAKYILDANKETAAQKS